MATTRKERIAFAAGMRRRPTRSEYRLHNHMRWMRNHVGKKGKQLMMYTRQKLRCGYILDFYFLRCKLCVEVDGGSHNTKKQKAYDLQRDERLAGIGVKTMRFTNDEVMKHVDIVAEKIYAEIQLRGIRKGSKRKSSKKKTGKKETPMKQKAAPVILIKPASPSTIHKLMEGLSSAVDSTNK